MNPGWVYIRKPQCWYCSHFSETEEENKKHMSVCIDNPSTKRCPTCVYFRNYSFGTYCYSDKYRQGRELTADEWVSGKDPCPAWIEANPILRVKFSQPPEIDFNDL